MATRKTAAPKPALPYAKKLLTAWKNVGQRAAAGRSTSLSGVWDQPGTREALAATYDAGLFPAAAFWRTGLDVADLAPGRVAPAVLATRPPHFDSLLFAYVNMAGLLARCLREDPTALDAFAETAGDFDRSLVDLARAEATAPPDGAPPAVRATLAQQFTAISTEFPALAMVDGQVTRLRIAGDARRAALDATLGRIFGPHLAADLAAAHGARLAAYLATPVGPQTFPLYPSPEALRLAAPALTPEEVVGYQVTFVELYERSTSWSVDDFLRAADVTRDRGRPGGALLANSLAVLAIARDPACAPQAERHLNLGDLSNQASPSPAYALAVLLRAPAEWKRHYALDRVFAPGAYPSTFGGPIALVLLASVDLAAAEGVAAEHDEHLDAARINGFDPAVLMALLDPARPALTRLLRLPTLVGYCQPGANPPAALDAYVVFEGTWRDSWLIGYLLALPRERAVAIVRRELAAGRAEWARAALAGNPARESLLAEAEAGS